MEQMRKGNDLNRGLRLGGPLHITCDPRHLLGRKKRLWSSASFQAPCQGCDSEKIWAALESVWVSRGPSGEVSQEVQGAPHRTQSRAWAWRSLW